MNENTLTQILPFNDKNLSENTNTFLQKSLTDYMLSSKRFDPIDTPHRFNVYKKFIRLCRIAVL